MRVLQVTHRYPPQTGGVETHVRELSERLVKRGHDVTVFSADRGENGTPTEHRNGVEVRRFRSFAPSGAMYFAPGIVHAVRRLNADVVHAHNYHAFPALFAALGVVDERFILTPHYHGQSASPLRNKLLLIYHLLGRWLIRRADEVIAVSQWERNQLLEDFSVSAVVIPNGLNIDQFTAATPIKFERPYLLCVGRLEDYKGVQHGIRALPALPGYDLVVAGKGPYRETLEEIAREAGVENRVKFIGYVSDDRLPRLYSGAAALLALSSFEAYGMTVAEALAAGTPCVIRECRGLKRWAGSNGVTTVMTPTTENISEAVEAAVGTSPSTEQLIDWETMTDRVSARYVQDAAEPQ